jgi:ABC-type Na+ efflux pump permease subunit
MDRAKMVAALIGWSAASFMVMIGAVTWVLNLNVVIEASNKMHRLPVEFNTVAGTLILIAGFVVIVAALCGAFRIGKDDHGGSQTARDQRD